MTWHANRDEYDAMRLIAQREADAKVGPCPHCGASAHVDLLDTSVGWGEYSWIPGMAHCTANCYESDPEGYLASIKAWKQRTS